MNKLFSNPIVLVVLSIIAIGVIIVLARSGGQRDWFKRMANSSYEDSLRKSCPNGVCRDGNDRIICCGSRPGRMTTTSILIDRNPMPSPIPMPAPGSPRG